MKIQWTAAAIVGSMLMVGSTAHAHPGGGHEEDAIEAVADGLRLWTSAATGSTFSAWFASADEKEVRFRDKDGKAFALPRWYLCEADDAWVSRRVAAVRRINERFVAFQDPESPRLSALRKAFEPFKDKLKFRSDDRWFYVESDGLPSHPMMKGIRSWQQQVPLPQPYAGANAWRIPLKPVLAEKPISAKTALFRGAIALAVNGVPIFNALNNRGEDTLLAGELDEWGGHCGRGDDYHYHIAPLHLEKIVGVGSPIAFALDGFPIFGLTEADGSPVGKLDAFNGKFGKDGEYRYHATKTFPYVNGGLRGVVEVRGDQVEPQPRDAPARPGLPPLKGATITGFSRDDAKKTFAVIYDLRGRSHSVTYAINRDDTVTFVFDDGAGTKTTETYRRREPKDKGPDDKGPKKGPKDSPEKKKKKGPDEQAFEEHAPNDEPADQSPTVALWRPWSVVLISVGGVLMLGALPSIVRSRAGAPRGSRWGTFLLLLAAFATIVAGAFVPRLL